MPSPGVQQAMEMRMKRAEREKAGGRVLRSRAAGAR